MKYAVLAGLLLAQSAALENNSEEAKQYIQIAEGLVDGKIDISAQCLEDVKELVDDGVTLEKDIQGKHFLKLYGDVKKVLADAKSIEGDCTKKTELSKMVDSFAEPTSFEWGQKGEISFNHVDIYADLQSAVASLKAKDFKAYGQMIRAAVTKINAGKETQQNMKKDQLAKVTEGILKAYDVTFNFEALLFCIYDEDEAALMLDTAVEAFREFLHAPDVEQKIGDLLGVALGTVGAYKQFQAGLPACEHVFTSTKDIAPIEKSMSYFSNTFTNLPEMTANVQKHSEELLAEAQQVGDDMEKFGEFIGHLLKKATQHEEVKSTTLAQVEGVENASMVVTEFLQGLFEATKVGDFNFTALLDCILFADQDVMVVYEVGKMVVEDWKDIDFTDVFIALCGAGVLFGQVTQTVKYCEAVDPSKFNWTNMDRIATTLKNKDYKTVGENLIFQGVDITNDFKQAMKAQQAKEYKEFGFLLGNALMLATQPQDNNLFLY